MPSKKSSHVASRLLRADPLLSSPSPVPIPDYRPIPPPLVSNTAECFPLVNPFFFFLCYLVMQIFKSALCVSVSDELPNPNSESKRLRQSVAAARQGRHLSVVNLPLSLSLIPVHPTV